MAESYRETRARCPTCDQDMELREVRGATIDVCLGCGGLWIDWFDGELQAMVRGAGDVTLTARPGDSGTRGCPRCQRELAPDRFGKAGAVILRCAECAGAFVPHDAIEAIVTEERREPGAPVEVSPFARLVSVLRHVFG